MTDESRVALITGAARGIGMAIAELFVAEGSSVAVSDIDGLEAKSVVERLDRRGRTLALELDVTQQEVQVGVGQEPRVRQAGRRARFFERLVLFLFGDAHILNLHKLFLLSQGSRQLSDVMRF